MVLGALTGALPSVEGFAPLPSHTAEAFMVLQGGQMALDFGAQYTIGKRIMAALSNEKFNEGVKDPHVFTEILKPHHQEMTKRFIESVKNDTPVIQKLVMEKAYDLEMLKIEQNVKLILAMPAAYFDAIHYGMNRLEGREDDPRYQNGIIGYINGEAQYAEGYGPDGETPQTTKAAADKAARQAAKREAKQKQAVKTAEKYANLTYDQSIIGKGRSYAQLSAAISQFENLVRSSESIAKSIRASGNTSGNAQYNQAVSRITTYTKIIAEYKKAQAWLRKTGAKTTP